MATKKILSDSIKKIVNQAKTPQKLVILHIPDHSPETAPHWLFWFFVISLVALAVVVVGTHMMADPTLQTYLPTL